MGVHPGGFNKSEVIIITANMLTSVLSGLSDSCPPVRAQFRQALAGALALRRRLNV